MMEKDREITEELFAFIESAPTAFHAVDEMKQKLDETGYIQLLEGECWNLQKGGKYYVIRNGSSILAFRIPKEDFRGFQIMASHSDSPSFMVKENPEMTVGDAYVKLNVEKYGGMLCAPWFDRPLSVAGRLVLKKEDHIAVKLVSADRNLVMIPNLAIHLNREANDGYKYNVQKDMLPLFAMADGDRSLRNVIAEAAGVKEEDIIGSDLYLYNRMHGTIWGANEEFISIGRLDDLQCAFASFQAFLAAEDGESIPVHCVFDNEEIGSGTKQGAASTFLYDTLSRIVESLGGSGSDYRRALASSFMISADNAQAVHPNYPEKYCPTNRVFLNRGIALKYSANQKYTTDGVAAALFTQFCEYADVPYQVFYNRSDMPGGSTLGNLSGNQVAVKCVDIGLPQLAMHSPYETAGIRDTAYLIRVAKQFYESSVVEKGYGTYEICR